MEVRLTSVQFWLDIYVLTPKLARNAGLGAPAVRDTDKIVREWVSEYSTATLESVGCCQCPAGGGGGGYRTYRVVNGRRVAVQSRVRRYRVSFADGYRQCAQDMEQLMRRLFLLKSVCGVRYRDATAPAGAAQWVAFNEVCAEQGAPSESAC